jgi:hypothetical protein
MGVDLVFEGSRLDGVLVGVHDSSDSLEVLFQLAQRLLPPCTLHALEGGELALEIRDLLADVVGQFVMRGHLNGRYGNIIKGQASSRKTTGSMLQ